MGFKQCSSCKGFYNASLGGCVNPNCTACDKARVAQMNSTPMIPKAKPKVGPILVAAPVALRRRPAPPIPVSKKTASKKPSIVKNTPRKTGGIGAPPKDAGPMPVAIDDSEEMSRIEQEQGEAGYHIIYRGDSRKPAELVPFGGFTAWVPLKLHQAQDVVKRSRGENFKITLPKEAKRLEDAFNRNMNLNLMTLGRQIKLEKAGDTFHISTDPTEGCGGYTSGYIYAFKFKTLYLMDKLGKVTTGALTDVKGINPKLVLDKKSLSDATVIGLAIPGQAGVEVAFLTDITMDRIYKYRKPKSNIWYKMPGH
ncbi:MAG: hypothetical protein ABIK28_18945 [Planctomycetota bacterium]